MSDTPRTEDAIRMAYANEYLADPDSMRSLEREFIALREAVVAFAGEIEPMRHHPDELLTLIELATGEDLSHLKGSPCN